MAPPRPPPIPYDLNIAIWMLYCCCCCFLRFSKFFVWILSFFFLVHFELPYVVTSVCTYTYAYFLWYEKLIMSLSFCRVILTLHLRKYTIHNFIKKSMDIGSVYWWSRLIKNEHPFFYDHLYLWQCIVRQVSVKERPFFRRHHTIFW